jgi:hypothetical protein
MRQAEFHPYKLFTISILHSTNLRDVGLKASCGGIRESVATGQPLFPSYFGGGAAGFGLAAAGFVVAGFALGKAFFLAGFFAGAASSTTIFLGG